MRVLQVCGTHPLEGSVLGHASPWVEMVQFIQVYLQSHAKRVETLCLLKRIFRSRTSLFSFTPPPHFNVFATTKSIRQSNILNIEKGEGELIECNAISLKTTEKAQVIAKFLLVSQPFCTGLLILK